MTARQRAVPAAGGIDAVVLGSEVQQRLQRLYPVHSEQQDGHGHLYSSGNPEGGSESNKNKNEFLEKLRQARFSVKPSLGSVDSTVSAYELLRLRLRISRFVLIINVV